MKKMATFSDAGWDIANTGGAGTVWRIYEGYTYPLLNSFLKPLTITADNVVKIYDGTAWNKELQNVNYNGADTTKIFNRFSPYGVNGGKNVGTYMPKLYSNQQGYDISYNGGTLNVNPAPLTIKANDMEKTYGDEITFNGTEFTAKGLVNNESIGKVDLTSDGAPKTAPVGTYDIIPSNAQGGTFNPNNYKITYEKGKLNVNPAPSSIRDIYYPIIEENYYIPSSVTNHHKSHYVSLNSANINVEPHWKSNYLIIDKRNIENINYLKIENLTQSTIQGKNKGKLNKGRY